MTASDPLSSSQVKETGLADRIKRGRPPTKVREEAHEPEREPRGRAQRVPLGIQRLKLQSSQRPGFVRRWVNDDGARIQMAQQGGYEFVRKDGKATTTDAGEAVSQIGGKSEGGVPMRIYLMEIREDWYQDDQATKQESIDATEKQIRRGELVGKVGQDGVYIPSQGISIKRAG